MDIFYTFFTLFGCSAVWLLPTALAAAALVDMIRVRAEWYWCFVIFAFPVLGPVAYFAVSYLPIFGNSRALSNLSPATYKRTQARRRLREIQIQLQHWRGPALLAEAGAQYLMLGKMKQAEDLLREAKAADADVKDVNFNFAQVLQVRGLRWQEALPLLQELVDLEPDARFGAARLALARCLDETGATQRAEEELRAVLKKRSPPEARVRLARLLLARGDGREATELLAEVRSDALTLPKYLFKEHKPWIRVAQKLKATGTKLPAPRLEGVPPRLSPAVLAVVAVAILVVLGVLLTGLRMVAPMVQSMSSIGDYQDLWQAHQDISSLLAASDRKHPSSVEVSDPTSIEAALPAFLGVRRSLGDACTQVIAAHEKYLASSRQALEANNISSALGTVDHTMAWERAQVELGQALAASLDTGATGRPDFHRLITLVDGAFLEREEARVLTLPEHFRGDYMQALTILEQPLPPRREVEWRRDVEANQATARAKLESFQALAESIVTDESRALLEPRRAELESSMSAECLEPMLQYLDPELSAFGDYGGY